MQPKRLNNVNGNDKDVFSKIGLFFDCGYVHSNEIDRGGVQFNGYTVALDLPAKISLPVITRSGIRYEVFTVLPRENGYILK